MFKTLKCAGPRVGTVSISRLGLVAGAIGAVSMTLAGPVVRGVGPSGPPVPDERPAAKDRTEANAVAMRAFSRIYRLNIESSYESNAVACDIPDVFSEALRGTLTMERVRVRPRDPDAGPNAAPAPIERYLITDVNLILDAPLEAERITGRGEYEIYPSVGMLTVLGERLRLEVTFGDNEPVVLDSGIVPADGDARSFDLVAEERATSVAPCVLRSLRVAAELVPRDELIPYGLGDAAFYSVQYSPFGPVIIHPLSGRMLLTRLPLDPALNDPTSARPRQVEWGMVRVNWAWYDPSLSSAALPARFDVSGSGIYQQRVAANTTDPARSEERLVAELLAIPPYPTFAPVQPQGFDSGWVAGPAPANVPPVLNIRVRDTDPAFPIETYGVVAGPRHSVP